MRSLARALALALPLGLAGVLAHSAIAEARPVRITTTLKPYGGDGAYLAIYITDPQGKLAKTVRIAGGKAKYHKHLSAWNRLSGGKIDGTTGASVGSGQSLTVSIEIADALIDAGYEIRIDSAVENESDVPGDAVAPLATAGAGKPVAGRGYVKSLTFDM
ncbi:DUF2271 domain-containing protein [Bosea sp. (in: a-proteobacteria)]|uniref:DUF2271 domain-containing protein n=1 Tax=Bosea sp. (in: a-proteobacteria) TaxID=1871050 RepID=UPI002B4812DA|nr:DUF2271 domain-containing protein [Bosea sp. (in: a-proteobacteria)]WRH58422.1 MAG: DUF2271 domain-containing protein [Bosea sp. (in: a-proteobacteria)]